MSTKTAIPTDWHKLPKDHNGFCPVCQCPTRAIGGRVQHRATTPDDQTCARWLRRKKSATGWKVEAAPGSPIDWHIMPATDYGACSVCNCPAWLIGRAIEHRGTTPEDNGESPWVSRCKSPGGWQEKAIGSNKIVDKRKSRKRKPTARIRRRIRQVANWMAHGVKLGRAAANLGLTTKTLSATLVTYPEIFAVELARARTEGQATLKTPPDPPETGPTEEVVATIGAATKMLAKGSTLEETAAALEIKLERIRHLRRYYPELWSEDYSRAMEVTAGIVGQLVGAEATMTDPAAHLRSLHRVQRWKQEKDVARGSGNGEAARQPLSVDMSLRGFYESYFRPICLQATGARPDSIEAYEISVRLWDQYVGEVPLRAIDERVCAMFTEKVAARPGVKSVRVSPNTIRGRARHIQVILDRAGPRTREKRQNASLLAESPYVPQPRPRVTPPTDIFTLEEIAAWMAACDVAQRPKLPDITPGEWWRALVRFIYNVGTRIRTTIELRFDMIDGEWIDAPPESMKCLVGKRLYLNQPAREAIESVRKGQARIFAWPYTRYYLQTVRREILAASTIPPERRFGFHSLRRALATELARTNPLAAQLQLGHAGMAVTKNSYISRSIIADAIRDIPQPAMPTGGKGNGTLHDPKGGPVA